MRDGTGRSPQRVTATSPTTAASVALRPLPAELEEEAETVAHEADPALGQSEHPDRLVLAVRLQSLTAEATASCSQATQER